MIHHYLEEGGSSAHWGVSVSTINNTIIAQIDNGKGDYARVALTPEQAIEFGNSLLTKAQHIQVKS